MQFDVTAKSSASTSTIEYSNVSRWEITLAPGEILHDAQLEVVGSKTALQTGIVRVTKSILKRFSILRRRAG